MTTIEKIAALEPEKARQLIAHRAKGELFTFLGHIHPIVAPESAFIPAAHLRTIAWHAQQVVEGKIRRLLIAVPPRHFKSYVASVGLPAWALGKNPGLRVICASYGSDLAKTFALQSRSILTSPAYRRVFPELELRSKNPPIEKLSTTMGGYRFATSVGGVVTGLGADLIIIDDPLKADQADSLTERENAYNWFKGSMMSRFDKPAQGGVIVVMQRLHQDDLIGRLLQEEGWTYLKLPGEAQERLSYPCGKNLVLTLKPGKLLFPDRFDAAALAQLRNDLGEPAYNAQILQAPAPPGGALIKLKHFQRYEILPPAHQIERIFQVWDTALVDSPTADFSVCTTWAISAKRLFLVDVLRRQMTYPQLEKAVLDQRAKHKADYVLLEGAGSGISLYQNLRQLAGLNWLHAIKPTTSKLDRICQQIPKIERGRVFLPKSAPWLEAFEHEVAEFPRGRFDDQVDSMAYLLRAFDYGNHGIFRDLAMFNGWVPGQPVL